MGKPTLKQFAAHSKQTLDDAAARLAKLEAASVQSDTKPTAAQKAGADLARAKMVVGLAQAGVVDPEAEAGKASAKARRSGGLLVPVKPTQTELDLPVNEAGAGAEAARRRQGRK